RARLARRGATRRRIPRLVAAARHAARVVRRPPARPPRRPRPVLSGAEDLARPPAASDARDVADLDGRAVRLPPRARAAWRALPASLWGGDSAALRGARVRSGGDAASGGRQGTARARGRRVGVARRIRA